MLVLLQLITTGDALGALMLASVWLLLLHRWLALASWWGCGRGWRTVLAGFAVLETVFQFSLHPSEGAALAPYTLRGWYPPVQILTAVCIIAWLFRSRAPEHALPLCGKRLDYFLAAAGTVGLVIVGPCGAALWHSAYAVGLFGNAYGLTGVSGCILPSRMEIAAEWMTLLVGLPYMLLVNSALLTSFEAFAQPRRWVESAFLLRRAAAGAAVYGKALIRNESIW